MAEYKEKKFNDLGFGNKSAAVGTRSLNKDGSFNIKKVNIPFLERINFFHSLISMSWLSFFGVIIFGYLLANLFFAGLYLFVGVENLTGISGETTFDKFVEAFFFSAQTLTTLGYGRVAPVGIATNTIAAIESMLGLLLFALATGLLYGRFSSPNANIKYSNHAVIAPYQNINGFMFRVINLRKNLLYEVEVTLTFSLQKQNSDLRDFFALELERQKVVFFPSTWTIVHPISDTSPLIKLTEKDFVERDAEFIITIKAFDSSLSQTVYSHSSYKANEILWGEKFAYIIKHEEDVIIVDASQIDNTEKATLN